MPATPPYDTVNTVINAARTRLNDELTTLQPTGGKILGNTQPFSQQIVNSGWRKLQEFLANLGYKGLKAEKTFTAVPACTSVDPLVQVYLSYAGYFDGAVLQNAPVLPQDLIQPYDLWERQSGTSALLTEMDPVLNGLPSVPHMNWNRQWEWRDDILYMPGALVATDIRLRYAAYIADFADIAASPGPNQVIGAWYVQPVPIMRCLDAFADYMCREIEIARGNADAAMAFQASAESNAHLVLNRDTARAKAITKSSEYGKMRDRYTPRSGEDKEPIDRG